MIFCFWELRCVCAAVCPSFEKLCGRYTNLPKRAWLPNFVWYGMANARTPVRENQFPCDSHMSLISIPCESHGNHTHITCGFDGMLIEFPYDSYKIPMRFPYDSYMWFICDFRVFLWTCILTTRQSDTI